MRPRNILAATLLLLLLFPAAARAQQQQRDMEKEQQICEHLKIIAPSSVETFKRATEALDAARYEEAARLYAEVRKEAPDFTPGLRREGFALTQSGKRDEGLALLERAAKLE